MDGHQDFLNNLWSNEKSYGPKKPVSFVPEQPLENLESQPSTHSGSSIQSFYLSVIKSSPSQKSPKDTSHDSIDTYECPECKVNVPLDSYKAHTRSIAHLLSLDSSQVNPPTFYAINEQNRGHQMLNSLGWSDTGLGRTETGRKAPLKASMKQDRKGIGLSSSSEPNASIVSSSTTSSAAIEKRKKPQPPPRSAKRLRQQTRAETRKWCEVYAYLGS